MQLPCGRPRITMVEMLTSFIVGDHSEEIQIGADLCEANGYHVAAQNLRNLIEEVSAMDVAWLLWHAFDGGRYSGSISHWSNSKEALLPEGFDMGSVSWPSWPDPVKLIEEYIAPLVDGGCVVVTCNDGSAHNLDREAISRGLNLMRSDYGEDWRWFTGGTYNAATADVFVQLCLFCKVKYQRASVKSYLRLQGLAVTTRRG
jgi:hypothetical protein